MTAEPVTTASRSPRQEQLVVEAARLFASRGYAAVSMQQLATRAGITPGAIYRHFAGKSDLRTSAPASPADAGRSRRPG